LVTATTVLLLALMKANLPGQICEYFIRLGSIRWSKPALLLAIRIKSGLICLPSVFPSSLIRSISSVHPNPPTSAP
jgi:hypothetical protein